MPSRGGAYLKRNTHDSKNLEKLRLLVLYSATEGLAWGGSSRCSISAQGILSRKSINIKHYSMLQSTWARRTQQSYGYALSSSTHSIIKTKLLLLNLLHWKNIHVNNQGHQHFSFFIFIRLTFYSIPVTNKASYQLKQKNILMFILQVLVWLVSSIGWVLKRRLLWWWKLWLQL